MKSILLVFLLLLVGCGHSPEKIIVTIPTFIPVSCEEFGNITPIRPLPVIFVKAVDREGYYVLGLRGDQYANLSINSAETLRYIREQRKAIDYYKKCIADHNAKQKEGEP